MTPLISLLKTIYQINVTAEKKAKLKRSPITKSVYFVWACSDEQVYGWFSDVLQQIQQLSGVDHFPAFHPFVHLTRQKETTNPELKCGDPNLVEVFQQIGEDQSGRRVAVFACGPSSLVNDAWDVSMKRSALSGTRFDFHHETFEF